MITAQPSQRSNIQSSSTAQPTAAAPRCHARFRGGLPGAARGRAAREAHTTQPFEQGDCLVFLSHKWHSVLPLLRGTRSVLVLELWEGESCTENKRCMGACFETADD